jgi:hypothetical protein
MFTEPDLVVSSVDVAVHEPAPVPEGVNVTELPLPVIAPPAAVHVTVVLKLPVPRTVAVHEVVCDVVTPAGLAVTVTDDTVGGAPATVTCTGEDFFVESCVEAAVMFAVPAATPVTTPLHVTLATAALSDA